MGFVPPISQRRYRPVPVLIVVAAVALLIGVTYEVLRVSEASAAMPTLERPDSKGARAAQVAEIMARIYEDIGTMVGLDEAEAAALIRTLVDQRMRVTAAQIDEADPVARVAVYNAMQARDRSEIEAQIGRLRAAAFEKYQESVDARYRVERLRRDLGSEGLPLSEAQRKTLIETAIDSGAYLPAIVFTGAESPIALDQAMFAREQQRDQRFVSIARPVLTNAQWQFFNDLVQAETQATESHLREMETITPGRAPR